MADDNESHIPEIPTENFFATSAFFYVFLIRIF